MADYNPATIDDFPTTGKILSSDNIIVFEKQSNGRLSPHIYALSALYDDAVISADFEDLKNKYDSVIRMINDAKNYLNKNFIKKTDAEKLYSTITNFDKQFAKLETLDAFKLKLTDKADTEYLDFLYNKIKSDCQRIKARLGDGSWKMPNGDNGYGYKYLTASKAAVKEG